MTTKSFEETLPILKAAFKGGRYSIFPGRGEPYVGGLGNPLETMLYHLLLLSL